MVLKKLSQEIVFDGHPNDAAWDEVELLPLIVLRPDYGNEPSEKTEIKLPTMIPICMQRGNYWIKMLAPGKFNLREMIRVGM